MPVFNLDEQNAYLDNKIVAGLERLSQVFRSLLWEKAKVHGLSPIQIQVLIFIRHHGAEKATVSYLAKEFNLTKATISDAVKVLEQKGLVKKLAGGVDSRSYLLGLTAAGRKVVTETEGFADALRPVVATFSAGDKTVIWESLFTLIAQLNKQGVISVQRMCFNCTHYAKKNGGHYCNLLLISLQSENIRIDCPEFESVAG